ncbi:GATA zinc finger domain containing 2A [Cichlidogyrus casuarinus]|uniref:GATA zinc finger domain containing 2A n=1 Tax=Cichlidogyrus casuarinus TaxID=1844966 RepID=A0ABD2QN68_9PLAT
MNVVQSPSPHVNGLAKPLMTSLPESCADSDVILLSDEEEEIVSKKPRQNGLDKSSKSDTQALVIKLENELRNEESVLNLLQQIRANQRGVHKATKVAQSQMASSRSGFVETIDISSDQESSIPSSQKDKQMATIKVTKQVALSAIEQQFSAKRVALRKQLEKSLERVSIPASNASSSEIAFVPSVYSGDFLSLIGLEEVCRSIRVGYHFVHLHFQDFDPSMSKSEPRKVFNPFTCARCETDFTPVWKRDKPGAAGVACESCLAGSFRVSVQKEYATAIKMALKDHAASEKELDQEYQQLISDEDKLQAFMRDHEKKLNQQLAANANRGVSAGAVNGRSNGSATTATNSALVSTANGNAAQTTAAALQQQQMNLAQVQLLAQLQQQQKAVAAAANNNQTNAILNAMAASGATNLSQQQQRLTSLLTQMQSQPQTPQEALQMAQIQQVLSNSLQPQQNSTGGNSAQQQQMLSSMLLQYQLLQRQQQQPSVQQQLAMAQQQQQQQMLMLQAAQQQQYLQLLQNLQQQQQQQGKK